jgi:hypothetical protein
MEKKETAVQLLNKQSAVEWLGLELNIIFHDITPELWEEVELKFQQAKKMEKEQMKEAALNHVTTNEALRKIFENQFEQYYNETYGGNNE